MAIAKKPLLFLIWLLPLMGQAQNGGIGAPVMGFFQDTLFFIQLRSGSLTAEERANRLSEKIQAAGKIQGLQPDSIKIVPSPPYVDLRLGEQILLSISPEDAQVQQAEQTILAQQYREKISGAIARYQEATNWITLLKEIALVALVVVLFWYLLKYLNYFFRWLQIKIARQENRRIKGLTLKNYTVVDASRQVAFLLQLSKLLRWFSILLLLYFTLPVLFSIFPWTRNIAETLFGYILNPIRSMFLGLWRYLPNLFTIAVIFLTFRYMIKGLAFLKDEIEQENLTLHGFYPDWANPTYQILRVLFYAFMFVLIFPYLPGSESPIFQGVSVFLGFLFTLSSAGSLSNIVAGLVLTYMRLFKMGDRVKIGDISGDIIEKSLLVTRIRTIKNEIISIPNATVMGSHTINYSSEAAGKGLILHTTITLGYDVPWKLVHQTLIEAALRCELVLKDPAPFVLQTGLEDFYVSYQLNAYTKQADQQAWIYSELHQQIQDGCRDAGIEILSPHYQAERDGNASTIPLING